MNRDDSGLVSASPGRLDASCSSRRCPRCYALNRQRDGARRLRTTRAATRASASGCRNRRRRSGIDFVAPGADVRRAARPHHAAGGGDGRRGGRRRLRSRRLAGLLRHQQRRGQPATACTATTATARSPTCAGERRPRRREPPRHRRVDGRGLGRLRQRRLRGPAALQVRPAGAVPQRRRPRASSPVGERAGLPRVGQRQQRHLARLRPRRPARSVHRRLLARRRQSLEARDDADHAGELRVREQRRPQVPAAQPRRRHVRGRDRGDGHPQPALDAGRDRRRSARHRLSRSLSGQRLRRVRAVRQSRRQALRGRRPQTPASAARRRAA